jgi:hypothetical protein
MALTPLYTHHTCADTGPSAGILVAENPAQAEALWRRCRGRLVLGSGNGTGQRPETDYGAKRLIYIHMGTKPTGGFRLDLSADRAQVVDRTLIIPVRWESPAQDAIVPQMVTHPCLLVAAPKAAYTHIQVVDQTGRVRLSMALEAPSP